MTSSVEPSRNAAWVLGRAAIALPLIVWAVVLGGFVRDVQQSRQLATVAHEAERFARLPRVTSSELHAVVARRLSALGYSGQRFVLVPRGDSGLQIKLLPLEG